MLNEQKIKNLLSVWSRTYSRRKFGREFSEAVLIRLSISARVQGGRAPPVSANQEEVVLIELCLPGLFNRKDNAISCSRVCMDGQIDNTLPDWTRTITPRISVCAKLCRTAELVRRPCFSCV